MFYGILLLIICIVGLFGGRRGGCDICGTDFKRTIYTWNIRGRKARLCPTCSGKLDRKRSKLAFRPGTEVDVPLIPERPPDRRGLIISMLVLLGIGFFVWSTKQRNGVSGPSDTTVTNVPSVRHIPSAISASSSLPSEISLTTPIRIPVTINGKPSGTITLQAGTRVKLVSVRDGTVVIRHVDSMATVPLTSTDLHLPTR